MEVVRRVPTYFRWVDLALSIEDLMKHYSEIPHERGEIIEREICFV